MYLANDDKMENRETHKLAQLQSLKPTEAILQTNGT